jgi:signal transduction histidine kinase
MTRRFPLVYGLLLAVWGLIVGWQVVEHARVRRATRGELINRARDISTTVGIVLRSQRHFGGVVTKERLESALTELIRPGELNGVALLNEAGDVVASAGAAIEPQPKSEGRTAEVWGGQTVTLMNLVALGTNVTRDLEGTNPPIVLSRQDLLRPFDTNRPPPPPREGFRPDEFRAPGTNDDSQTPPPGMGRGRPRGGSDGRRGGPDGRPRFPRPFWMSEEEFKAVIQKQGVHSFVIAMSTQPMRTVCNKDLWLRSLIGLLATVSVVGSGLAWRNLAKSSDLQIRLVRASELNLRLKEMNLAAAGLAHETRNPLNIIRGLAQMISKQPETAPEVRQKSLEIVDETDRVTAQLNEFIDYSRPREVRRAAVALNSAVNEVVRALGFDLEEKAVRLHVAPDLPVIQADEQLLRQALFNLLMNAIQAAEPKGEIWVAAEKTAANEARLDIRDNGPGVPPERRTEIFKPYVTTQEKGTGLGLAVVQQIVLAHGWEIECLPNEPRGALFRLTHLRLAASSPPRRRKLR